MKNFYLLILFSFAALNGVFSQDCSDGSTPIERTLNLTGLNSVDGFGDADNETGVLSFGVVGDIVGIYIDNANLSTIGASWCSEVNIDFGGEIFTNFSAQNAIGPCSDLPYSEGFNLDDFGLVFPTDAAGDVSWEIFEDFDDNVNSNDAQFTSGTVTVFHCPTGTILPVTLVDFAGECTKDLHLLKWSTSQEINNEGFLIERSVNGRSWNELGWIAGNGTSEIERNYRYEDKAILGGTNYFYRLKQMDYDGSFHYSEVIKLGTPAGASEVIVGEVFPNPVAGHMTAKFQVTLNDAMTAQITLVDITGRKVLQFATELHAGSNTLDLVGTESLARGIYLLTIQVNDEMISRKVNLVD